MNSVGATAPCRSRLRRVTAWAALAVFVAVAVWKAEDAGWFDAGAVPVSAETARAMLADVTTWDAATSGERRGVAEQVDARLSDFTLLRVRPFGFSGHRHEIAVFSHAPTGLEFSLIPGGTFVMGSPEGEVGRLDDETQHEVTLTQAFLLARTECTQAAYARVMGTNPSTGATGPDHPVETVTWDDAQEFNARTGLRLPTEAEWEYACRAGTTTRFWAGDGDDDVARVGWIYERSGLLGRLIDRVRDWAGWKPPAASHRPVALKAASPFGLHDVHGNVWEWCADGYDDYSSSAVTDPTGSEAAPLRVSRGGGWGIPAGVARSAIRGRGAPGDRIDRLGFRPARSVTSE